MLRRDGLGLSLLDLDVAGLQVRAQLSDLVGVQIVLERDRLELFLGDQTALLSLFEKDADRRINVRQVQLASLLLLSVGCDLAALQRGARAHPYRFNEKDLPGIPGDPNVDSRRTLAGVLVDPLGLLWISFNSLRRAERFSDARLGSADSQAACRSIRLSPAASQGQRAAAERLLAAARRAARAWRDPRAAIAAGFAAERPRRRAGDRTIGIFHKPRADGSCPPGARIRRGSEMLHVWFTDDVRSAFAVHAPEPELCAARLLPAAHCRSGETLHTM